MITENLSTLKIHKLSQEQYDRELESGRIDANAIYLTPDEDVDLSGYATVSDLNNKADEDHNHVVADISNLQDSLNAKVPVSRTINGKNLSSNITLSASDVGAVPTTRTVNKKALSSNITLSASDVGALPVNGKAVSAESADWAETADTLTTGSWTYAARNTSYSYSSDDYGNSCYIAYMRYGKLVFYDFYLVFSSAARDQKWALFTIGSGLPIPIEGESSIHVACDETYCLSYYTWVEDGDLMVYTGGEPFDEWTALNGSGVYVAQD